MKVKSLENISDNDILIRLSGGNAINLHPHDKLKDIETEDLSEIKKYVSVIQELNEPKNTSGRMQLRD